MFLKSRLQASHPASVRVVTLLDKPSRRELNIKPDYVGKTIDDRFVVGYGMDSEELGRNYPDIYCLKN
jgi:hypoxanthine phosphoribosyltransferase